MNADITMATCIRAEQCCWMLSHVDTAPFALLFCWKLCALCMWWALLSLVKPLPDHCSPPCLHHSGMCMGKF